MKKILILIIITLSQLYALGCSCKHIESLDSLREKSWRQADLVFFGQLKKNNSNENYSFQIIEFLKGTINKDSISGKPFTSCSLFPTEEGVWIVYAVIKENGLIDISLCGASRPKSNPICWNCPSARPRAPKPGSTKGELLEFEKDREIRKIDAQKE